MNFNLKDAFGMSFRLPRPTDTRALVSLTNILPTS